MVWSCDHHVTFSVKATGFVHSTTSTTDTERAALNSDLSSAHIQDTISFIIVSCFFRRSRDASCDFSFPLHHPSTALSHWFYSHPLCVVCVCVCVVCVYMCVCIMPCITSTLCYATFHHSGFELQYFQFPHIKIRSYVHKKRECKKRQFITVAYRGNTGNLISL